MLTYDLRPKNISQYKYLPFLNMLFITIFIVCDTTAFRMTVLFGVEVPVSGLIIANLFALGDVIGNVYGYEISRKIIWNSLLCQFIFGITITLAISFPSPESNIQNIHYSESFKQIIRTNITSCLSVTTGMFVNSFLMSKFKIWMNGSRFWIRTIISSSISEFFLCVVAYSTLYVGSENQSNILKIILAVYLYKVLFALAVTPFTTLISRSLKKLEASDVFDYGINYNPFRYNYEDKDKDK